MFYPTNPDASQACKWYAQALPADSYSFFWGSDIIGYFASKKIVRFLSGHHHMN
jgi:hypothetical protein